MEVTFEDAYRDIASRSKRALSWVEWWRGRYAKIVPVVTTFVHRHLFEISSSEVLATLERGQHALGEIEKKSEIKIVEDLPMPQLAVQDLFHRFVEREKALPTWSEFREYLHEDHVKRDFLDVWWSGLRPRLVQYDRQRISEALQWRIGRMYYSNMREIDMLARMREKHDLHLRYHIFADVRLRTDFWIDDVNVSVFLSNPRYRGGGSARKKEAEEFFADAEPPFHFMEIEFPNLRDFGHLYRVSDQHLDRLAADIRAFRA